MKNKRTLTTGEAAAFCDVNIQTILRWIDKGFIKAYKLPGRGDKRIQLRDFVDFLRKNNIPIPEQLHDNKNRVLIVEDEPNMASAINRAVKMAGFKTKIANDGFHAGLLLKEFRPAIMTLDLMMPKMSGIEVIRTIRKSSIAPALKILVISARPVSELMEAKMEGADAVISKPFENIELIKTITNLTT